MTTLEKIQAELSKLDEVALQEVLLGVQQFTQARNGRKHAKSSIMQALRAIKIQGPRDFSRNLDLYLTGEKQLEEHLPGHPVRGRPRQRARRRS
jgi:hypothetical protein